jgi:hypothetical protein
MGFYEKPELRVKFASLPVKITLSDTLQFTDSYQI